MKNRDTYSDDNKKNNSKNKRKTGLGLALWILAALILFILFLVEQDKIISNLKEADFFHRVFGKTPSFVENHKVEEKVDKNKNDVDPIDINVLKNLNDKSNEQNNEPSVSAQNDVAESQIQKVNDTKEVSSTEVTKTTESENNPESTKASDSTKATESSTKNQVEKTKTEQKIPSTPAQMKIKLFFMVISSDGSVNRHEVVRNMKKSDSPLVDAINALIEGPNAEEEKAGCRSLIPAQSRLKGASVKKGIATLNFNGEFEFNQYGVEGTLGQLQQIVFTATAFPTVESVQFLVDGELKDYLGSEGVWIGTPLTRTTFK